MLDCEKKVLSKGQKRCHRNLLYYMYTKINTKQIKNQNYKASEVSSHIQS